MAVRGAARRRPLSGLGNSARANSIDPPRTGSGSGCMAALRRDRTGGSSAIRHPLAPISTRSCPLPHSHGPTRPTVGPRSRVSSTPIRWPLACGRLWLSAAPGRVAPQISCVLRPTLPITAPPGGVPAGAEGVRQPVRQAAEIVEGQNVAVAGRDEQLPLITRQGPHRRHAGVDQCPQDFRADGLHRSSTPELIRQIEVDQAVLLGEADRDFALRTIELGLRLEYIEGCIQRGGARRIPGPLVVLVA